ncbi:MAG: hypothetical protein FWF59_04155 [Turicibacter sp.]|nr:hypothetical protein [Turicibacter sp.]
MEEANKASESRINGLIGQVIALTEQLACFQNQVFGSKSGQAKNGKALPERDGAEEE